MSEFSRTSKDGYTLPKTTEKVIPVSGHGGQHNAILQNFAEAILEGKPLIAPAAEGLYSVELTNAMLLSAAKNRTIELPLDAARYKTWLRRKIAESKAKPAKVAASDVSDFSKSFHTKKPCQTPME